MEVHEIFTIKYLSRNRQAGSLPPFPGTVKFSEGSLTALLCRLLLIGRSSSQFTLRRALLHTLLEIFYQTADVIVVSFYWQPKLWACFCSEDFYVRQECCQFLLKWRFQVKSFFLIIFEKRDSWECSTEWLLQAQSERCVAAAFFMFLVLLHHPFYLQTKHL